MQQKFHPDFISRYTPLFSKEEFSDFLVSCNTPLRKAIRINTLKISEKDFLKRAKKNNWVLTPIPYVDSGYFIDREDTSIPLGKSIEYFAGLFYIQETSSMIPPMLLKDIDKSSIILDVSAAPGSKTTQIANYKEGNGLVIGNDIVPTRLKALKTNINYQGFINCACSKLDGRDFGRYFKESFDAILLDAPCSGEGTMRKDEVRWSMSIIEDLAKLQKRLLLSSVEALKVGGTLVYSTCTMTPEEDEAVLNYAKQELGDAIEIVEWKLEGLSSTPGMTEWLGNTFHPEVQKSQKIWPHINDTEGFFVSKIVKKAPTHIYDSLTYYEAKKEESILKGKELKVLLKSIEKRFNIDKALFTDYIIVKKGTELTIRTKQSKAFSSFAMMQNMGIPFGTLQESVFQMSFYAAQVFGRHASTNIIELEDTEQAELFRIGKDIKLKKEQCSHCSPGQVLIHHDNIILGASLLKTNNTLKNQVPRETIKI